jgi:hypothetical protein
LWCIHDSVRLEDLGVPTVTVCTEAFVDLATGVAHANGIPDLSLAVIPHPFTKLSPEEVVELAATLLPAIVRNLTHGIDIE